MRHMPRLLRQRRLPLSVKVSFFRRPLLSARCPSRPVESAPDTQERQLQLQGTPPSARGASVMPDETVVTFLPGHTSEDVRPSLTDSSSANRVLFYKDKDSHLSSPHSSASNSQCVTSTSVPMDSTSIKQEDAASSSHTGDSSDALPTREGASAS